MKVFVTGATGLVGSFVVRELIAKGHTPVLLHRKESSFALLQGVREQCEVVEGDILDISSLRMGIENCEAVIHCAGKISFDPKKEREMIQVNVKGTANVVNACLQSGTKKLIYVSSIAALGRKAQQAELNESTQWVDSELNSTYATTKYLAELEVFRGGEEGLDFSIVNPSIVLGPGEATRSSTRIFEQVKKLPYCYPNGYLNIVDVRDVAVIICQLLKTAHKERLVLTSEQLSYKEFYSIVRRQLGITGPFLAIPRAGMYIIAFFEGIRSFFVQKEPIVTKENLRFLHKKFLYSSLFYTTLFPDAPFIKSEESIRWVLEGLSYEKK